MSSQQGDCTPKMQEGRARLSVRDPLIEKLLSGLAIDAEELDEIRRFGKSLWAARNAWTIGKAVERNSLGRMTWGRK